MPLTYNNNVIHSSNNAYILSIFKMLLKAPAWKAPSFQCETRGDVNTERTCKHSFIFFVKIFQQDTLNIIKKQLIFIFSSNELAH